MAGRSRCSLGVGSDAVETVEGMPDEEWSGENSIGADESFFALEMEDNSFGSSSGKTAAKALIWLYDKDDGSPSELTSP